MGGVLNGLDHHRTGSSPDSNKPVNKIQNGQVKKSKDNIERFSWDENV